MNELNLNEDQTTWGTALIANIYDLPKEAIPEEMFEFLKIVKMGASKYALNNWLNEDGQNADERNMHASMFRHLAASSAGQNVDNESGEDHLLHLACRALMLYTRRQRNIIHPLDKSQTRK